MHPAIIFGSIFGALALASNNEDGTFGSMIKADAPKGQRTSGRHGTRRPPRPRTGRGSENFGRRRRRPRPSPMRLPGGKEIFEGEIKLNRRGNVARTWVFIRHGPARKMEEAAADRGLKLVGEEYDVDRVKTAVPITIMVPTPIGPVPAPFTYKGCVPYHVYIKIES